MTRIAILIKEAAWVICGQLTTLIGSLMLVRVLTEYLSPAEYGHLVLALTFAGLINQVVMGSVTNGIYRYYSIASENGDLKRYLHDCSRLMGLASLSVLFIFLTVVALLILTENSRWILLITATTIFSLLTAYTTTLNSIQNAGRHRAVVALNTSIESWLKIALAFGVIFWLDNTITEIVFSFACSSLIVLFFQLNFLYRNINEKDKISEIGNGWLNPMLIYSLPFVSSGLFTWFQQASDRWALQFFTTTNDVGQYAVLYQLGYSPMLIATGMLVNFLTPIFFNRAGDASDASKNSDLLRLTWRMTSLSLLITLIMVLLGYFCHEWLFKIFVAENFRGISYQLPWMLLAGGFFATSQILGIKIMSSGNVSELATVKIITSLFGVFLNLMGAMYAGVNGILLALIIYSLIYFIWMVIIARKIQNSKLINYI